MWKRTSRGVSAIVKQRQRQCLPSQFRAYVTGDNKFETICLHGGYEPDATTSCGVPLYRTSSFVFESTEKAANLFALKELGNIYTRLMNPTQDILEKRVAMMEGGLASLCLASGQCASFYSTLNTAEAGDNIIVGRNLYGGTMTLFEHLLPKMGIECRFIDSSDPSQIDAMVDDKTRSVFVEIVSNPALQICDIEGVATVAQRHKLPVIVDATFCTPYLCNPFNFGANVVTHSLTKWMGGHGVGIGGIVVDNGSFDWGGSGRHPLYQQPDKSYHGMTWGKDLPPALAPLAYILRLRTVPLRTLGGCISPDNAWMFLQGIETLPLRMDRHCENALAVAKYLKSHPAVEWVRYPGLEDDPEFERNKKYLKGKGGAMVVMELKGGIDAGRTFIDSLQIHRHLANVGDAKSLAIHSASTTHSQSSPESQALAGITPGMVRLAVGIENIADIIGDLSQAIESATGVAH